MHEVDAGEAGRNLAILLVDVVRSARTIDIDARQCVGLGSLHRIPREVRIPIATQLDVAIDSWGREGETVVCRIAIAKRVTSEVHRILLIES
jgi:hypothetical protein